MPGGNKNINGSDGVPFSSTNQPKNRRKPTDILTQLLKKVLKNKEDITIEGVDIATGQTVTIKVPVTNKEVIVMALLKQAAKGNVMAIKEVWDRTEGKATQIVEADITTNFDLSKLPIVFR